MSRLKQHKLSEVKASEGNVEPGKCVIHINDANSFGVVIAQVDDKVSVLWTKEPHNIEINVQPISSTTCKLKAKWSAEVAEDHMMHDEFLKKYKDSDTLMKNDPTVTDVVYHYDHDEQYVEIKRRSAGPEFDVLYEIEGRTKLSRR